MATMLDLRGALYGRRPVPADDIWLNDSDIVLVTKTPIQQADELIEQVFTRGFVQRRAGADDLEYRCEWDELVRNRASSNDVRCSIFAVHARTSISSLWPATVGD